MILLTGESTRFSSTLGKASPPSLDEELIRVGESQVGVMSGSKVGAVQRSV